MKVPSGHPERSEGSRWGFFGLRLQNGLRIIWTRWKILARYIGIFQSRIILTVFYIMLSPVGVIFSFFKDELKIKYEKKSTWIKKAKQCETLEEMREQY